MKIRIKTYSGELPSYLTVGKVYEVVDSGAGLFDILDDNGELIIVDLTKDTHLNKGEWEVVE